MKEPVPVATEVHDATIQVDPDKLAMHLAQQQAKVLQEKLEFEKRELEKVTRERLRLERLEHAVRIDMEAKRMERENAEWRRMNPDAADVLDTQQAKARHNKSLEEERQHRFELEKIKQQAENELLLRDKHREEAKRRYQAMGWVFLGAGGGLLLFSSAI